MIVAAVLAGAPGCAPRRAPAGPEPLALPQAFRVEADGVLRVNDLRLPGRLRMDYLVYPGGAVVVSDLTAWIRDVDIVTHFLFWETDRERLRCTKLSNRAPMVGRLEAGGRLVLPPGAVDLTGVSFAARGPDRSCPGRARQVTARNESDVVATHDPVGGRFAMDGRFRARHEGEDLTLRIAMTGRYINRPPQALLGVFAPDPAMALVGGVPADFDLPQGGCPPLRGVNPPGAVANDPAGLRLYLISLSSDPDGRDRRGRGDVARDVWSLATDGGPFRSLGRTQIVGPVLFALHRDHVLVLTTADHSQATARMVCRFRVITPAEAGLEGGT
jgi:hypothetical protein